MQLNIKCDRNGIRKSIKVIKDSDTDECNLKADVESYESCPGFSITYMFLRYAAIFSVVFIGAGVVITFLGQKLFKIVLFILSAFVVAFVIFMFVSQVIFTTQTQATGFWITLGIAAVIGIILGILVVMYEKYCFALVGACLGGVLALFLYNLLLSKYLPTVLFFCYFLIACFDWSYCCSSNCYGNFNLLH